MIKVNVVNVAAIVFEMTATIIPKLIVSEIVLL